MANVSQALIEHEPAQMPTRQIEPAKPMTPMEMISQAVAAGQPIEVIRELMELSREIKREQALEAFEDAVAAAKAEIPVVAKNAKGHNDRLYADFSAYAKVVDPILGQHGLSYRFRTTQTDKITVTCILSHKAGHREETTLSGPADNSGSKNAIQAIGSTLTYLQRYSLVQALGLAAALDDDGKAAGKGEDDGTLITDEQAAIIRALIEETETGAERFCAFFKIDAVPELPASRFKDAIDLFEAKKRRHAQAS